MTSIHTTPNTTPGHDTTMTTTARTSALSKDLMVPAIADAFRKLSPRQQFRNPVMFVVFVCSVLTTILWLQALAGHGEAPTGFILWVAVWLWFTLLFANFAEAIAEGRGKAQAASLRGAPSRRGRAQARRRRQAQSDHPGLRIGSAQGRPGHHQGRRSDSRRRRRRRRRRPRSTRAPSPASPRRSSANPAATAARSPAARACCRTGSSCASPAIRARVSSIA